MVDPNGTRGAGLLRRLGAMLYDTILIAALWIFITVLLLPFTGGEAITAASVGAFEYVYQGVLLLIPVLFFGVFWVRQGQTLGMAAWRLKLERTDGAPITWMDAVRRLAGACVSAIAFGFGYLWILFDRDRRAWHDRWSRTRVIVLPKR